MQVRAFQPRTACCHCVMQRLAAEAATHHAGEHAQHPRRPGATNPACIQQPPRLLPFLPADQRRHAASLVVDNASQDRVVDPAAKASRAPLQTMAPDRCRHVELERRQPVPQLTRIPEPLRVDHHLTAVVGVPKRDPTAGVVALRLPARKAIADVDRFDVAVDLIHQRQHAGEQLSRWIGRIRRRAIQQLHLNAQTRAHAQERHIFTTAAEP